MSLKNVNHQKRSFTWSMEKPSAKDYFLTVFIFAVCTLIGLLFQKLNFTDTNIVTIYILGILLTSIVTDGYLCSVAGSFLSVFLFCFFLTEPRMSFKTYAVGYPVTFFIMLISSVLTGALAAKLKTHAKLSTQLAFRTQILSSFSPEKSFPSDKVPFSTTYAVILRFNKRRSCVQVTSRISVFPFAFCSRRSVSNRICVRKRNFIRGKAFLRGKRGHRRFFDTRRAADSKMGL